MGGDYYDYIPLPDGSFVVAIADVSGKGVPAALLMSNFQATLRTILIKSLDLREAVGILNQQIQNNAQGDHFISAFIAHFCPRERTLTYINCGHNPPVLLHRNHTTQLDTGTTLLGAFPDLPQVDLGQVSKMEEFLLFCYTDGLTETFNPAGEQFGEERLQQQLEALQHHKLAEVHNSLLEAVEKFSEGEAKHDDTTLLIVCS